MSEGSFMVKTISVQIPGEDICAQCSHMVIVDNVLEFTTGVNGKPIYVHNYACQNYAKCKKLKEEEEKLYEAFATGFQSGIDIGDPYRIVPAHWNDVTLNKLFRKFLANRESNSDSECSEREGKSEQESSDRGQV